MSTPSLEGESIIQTNKIVCPYCKSSIESTATKCKFCHEFLPDFKESNKKTQKSSPELILALIEFAAKALVPLTILILGLVFKPTLEKLLTTTEQAEFLGTKVKFTQTKSFTGNLTPTELYYLIGSASNYSNGTSETKGGLNYDILKQNGLASVLRSLEDKGLVKLSITKNSDKDINIFGKESLEVTPTEKGKDFLIELGLKFDGKKFIDTP